MSPWLEQLKIALEAKSNKENAYWMTKYMRNQFQFLGVKKPEQMEVFKQLFKSYPFPQNYLEIPNEMLDLPQHEFHYLAMVLVQKLKKDWDENVLDWVEKTVLRYPWWDVTDVLAPKILGPYFLKYPEQKSKYLDRWMASNNFWLQRMCIIYSLDYKQQTITEELQEIILPLASSKEFFIQKAIGWVLRQYARTNPNWVLQFVQNNSLPALSKREALKHLKS